MSHLAAQLSSDTKEHPSAFLTRLENDFLNFDRASLLQRLKSQVQDSLENSPFLMCPSCMPFVDSTCTAGAYIAMELGGTWLRTALVEVTESETTVKCQMSWTVLEDLKVCSMEVLLTWAATRLEEFLRSLGNFEKRKLGLSFSFPFTPTNLYDGQPMVMGKGYKPITVENSPSIHECLARYLTTKGIDFEHIVTLNDACASCVGYDRSTLALILGTGCNSAVYLPIQDFPRMKIHPNVKGSHVLTNVEMSMLGGQCLPWTKYDREIDANSDYPGYQPLEQFTSGLYLGEIIRLIMCDARITCGFMVNNFPPSLLRPMSLGIPCISNLVKLAAIDPLQAAADFSVFHPPTGPDYNAGDIKFITSVATIVCRRSAALIATSIAALSQFLERDANSNTSAVCSGSVVENYPNYVTYLENELHSLQGNVRVTITRDGSLLGIAKAAAICTSMPKEHT